MRHSPRSILVFSGRYHIIFNASLVNNCIILHGLREVTSERQVISHDPSVTSMVLMV